jgi:hypothetical protein
VSKNCYVIIKFTLKNENELKQLVAYIKELGPITRSSPAFISAKFHLNESRTVLINYATYKSAKEYNKLWEEVVTKLDVYKKILSFNPSFDQVFETSIEDIN